MRRGRNYRRGNRNVRNIVIICFVMILFLGIGYGAFQTSLSINAKGNVKVPNQEVDSKVPTNDLLFWGQADNRDNTLTTLKDKSSHGNDGILNGFNNTSVSGYNNGILEFDGVDDYVNIGLANYDFKNSQSYVTYVKINKPSSAETDIFNNFSSSGSGLLIVNNKIRFSVYDTIYQGIWYNNAIDTNHYYALVGTYDGTNVKLYVDGNLVGTTTASLLKTSSMPILIGANPELVGEILTIGDFANMSLKEAMLYDRTLTEEEVKTITEGFEKKYK